MTHLKTLAAAAAVVGGLGLATATTAAPLAPITTGVIAGDARVTDVAYGCGPGLGGTSLLR